MFGLEGAELLTFVKEQQELEMKQLELEREEKCRREEEEKQEKLQKENEEREERLQREKEREEWPRREEVYSCLSEEAPADYDQMKVALMKRRDLTEDGYQCKFRASTPETDENPDQFIVCLSTYFIWWLSQGTCCSLT